MHHQCTVQLIHIPVLQFQVTGTPKEKCSLMREYLTLIIGIYVRVCGGKIQGVQVSGLICLPKKVMYIIFFVFIN